MEENEIVNMKQGEKRLKTWRDLGKKIKKMKHKTDNKVKIKKK